MKKVAIVGAGISGLVLVSFLKKNDNYQITIFEKDIINNKNINGIQISPNALHILNSLDFDRLDQTKFYSVKGINFFDIFEKEKIASMKFNYLNSNQYLTMNRSDLIDFLIKNYSLEKNIINKSVSEIIHNRVILKDKSDFEFDIIVVADGIFSKLRPAYVRPLYSGFCAYRGFFSNSVQEEYINLLMGKNFHLVTYPIDQMKNNSFTLVSKTKKNPDDDNYNNLATNFNEMFQDLLPERFKKVCICENIKSWPIYSLNKIFYGNDNTFFIGDSAHGFIPSRAQGAAQAIEDSFALYKIISSENLSVRRFSKLRVDRVKKIKEKSENNLFIFHQSLLINRLIRNFIIRIICKYKFLTKKFNSFIFDYKIESNL